MNREVVINLFKKVARILEDDKQYEWLADEVKDYLNEIYVNKEFEPEQEQEQEPVAWMQDDIELYVQEEKDIVRGYIIPLYTAPPKREQEPLTRQQISEGNQSMFNVTREAFVRGVIFAEKMHGIGGGE
jgi:hypothetical protein